MAVAVMLAWPPDPMVAVAAERLAEAPLDGAVKVTTPPATGSMESLATTVTARALAKGVPVAVDCGVLPATVVRVNPWLWTELYPYLIIDRSTYSN